MLFPYKYITHDIELMQSYMDYIFNKVWLKAKEFDEFELSLFNGNKDLQEIIRAFYYLPDNTDNKKTNWGKYFVERVKNIFDFFQVLDNNQLEQLKYWYETNNKIEELCNGENSPIMYKELKFFHKDLSNEIQKLYANLYSQKVIGLKAFRTTIGKLDKHYKDFMKENIQKQQVCPFCGLHEMKDIYHTKKSNTT